MILEICDDNNQVIGFIRRDLAKVNRDYTLYLKLNKDEENPQYYKISPKDMIDLAELLKSIRMY